MAAFKRSDLADLNVFFTIARRGSFVDAANELGLTASALSHTMKKLEDRLEVRLLNRTNRSVALTTAGSDLMQSLAQGFEAIGHGLNALEDHRKAPVGRLRLNIPHDAGRLLILPVLDRFLSRFPQVHLDLVMDDRMLDIVAEGFDAGIRFGATVPQDMIAIPLTGALRWVVVGAPVYLDKHGRPTSAAELMQHRCIQMRIGDDSVYPWELGDGERQVRIEGPGPLRLNASDMAIGTAVAGLGLAYCLEMRVREELRSGALEVVMPQWASSDEPLVMYYPSRRQTPPALRQLIELIRADQGLS
ncbi:LysR family transcriptional regulator [Pseudomonas putida]|uniref:LysR family transcriptional regulator n=1 Tax=Pseudomonas putida TaxID=303 RepID=UPI0008192578|nr:LysR family transcriptional regulator [Pseudomonas putida]OCT25645.1 LysR family transcriptional regulator [Pseudomonas putida]OCT27568.1 LysR family transcriptional regulator [Pseudomonas putida]OCT32068.1 LysR family transcriptional regulator [Pseudomonas putida]OCT39060.1 LysR family transcriptional regulator [Pseudomonas putida]